MLPLDLGGGHSLMVGAHEGQAERKTICSQLVVTNQSLSVVDSDMPKLRIIGWVVRCQLGKTS